MKQNLLLVALLCVTLVANAQFTVETHAGDPIIDGQTVAFNSNIYPEASLDFYVRNQSATEQIMMKVEVVSAMNTDGSLMELCFGLCYYGVTIGNSYPTGLDVIIIDPGQTQASNGDHFLNTDDGGGNPVEYVFRFYQVDGAGNEIGEDLSFTYLYDSTLGIGDQNQVNATITSTVITDILTVNTTEDLQLTIYDLQGRAVQTYKAVAGRNDINMSNLRSQIYIVEMRNAAGASQTVKVVLR